MKSWRQEQAGKIQELNEIKNELEQLERKEYNPGKGS